MGDTVLILGGVGAVGIEASIDIINSGRFDRVIIADGNIIKAREFVKKVGGGVEAVKVNADNIDELRWVISKADYVVNALPFKYDYIVTKLSIDEGVSGLDVATTNDQFSLDNEARKNNVVFIPGMGATPGVTNIMARKGADILDSVDTIEIFWAAFRSTAPSPGLLYVTIWEFDPGLEERVVYEDGRWIRVPPFSGLKKVKFFPLIGERVTCIVPHSETYTIPRYLGKRVRRVYVRGTWPEETMNLLKTLLYYEFYGDREIEINGCRVKPMDFIYRFLLESDAARRTSIWGYGLVVHVYGVKNGEKCMVRLWNEHPHPSKWGGSRAYFKNIGIPLSIGLRFIVDGETPGPGVYPPEAAFNPDDFFSELEGRGIKINWSINYFE